MAKERAVAAIVLDHEQAHQKSGGRNGQQHVKAISDAQRPPHRNPKQNERDDGDEKLDDAAPMIGPAKLRQAPREGAHVDHGGARARVQSVVQNSLQGLTTAATTTNVDFVHRYRVFSARTRLFYAALCRAFQRGNRREGTSFYSRKVKHSNHHSAHRTAASLTAPP